MKITVPGPVTLNALAPPVSPTAPLMTSVLLVAAAKLTVPVALLSVIGPEIVL